MIIVYFYRLETSRDQRRQRLKRQAIHKSIQIKLSLHTDPSFTFQDNHSITELHYARGSCLERSTSRTNMTSIPFPTIPLRLRLRGRRLPNITLTIPLPIQLRLRLARARLLTLRETKPFVQEHLVHILETPPRRLRVEEIRDGHEASVEDSPDDVKPVAEVIDGAGRDVDDDEVGEPVGAYAEGDTLVARAKGHDLGGVHPADRENAPGEDVEEEEGECYEDPI